MPRKKEPHTLEQRFDRHWPRMPRHIRAAIRRACFDPDNQRAADWAIDLIHGLAPLQGRSAQARLALSVMNNRELPSVRRLVLNWERRAPAPTF